MHFIEKFNTLSLSWRTLLALYLQVVDALYLGEPLLSLKIVILLSTYEAPNGIYSSYPARLPPIHAQHHFTGLSSYVSLLKTLHSGLFFLAYR